MSHAACAETIGSATAILEEIQEVTQRSQRTFRPAIRLETIVPLADNQNTIGVPFRPLNVMPVSVAASVIDAGWLVYMLRA